MKKLKGNFTIIPNEYITDENLDCYEYRILCFLCKLSDEENTSYPSYETIARKTNISISKVKRAIEHLIDMEYISKKTRTKNNGGRASNIYTVSEKTCEDNSLAFTDIKDSIFETPPCDVPEVQDGISENHNKYTNINKNYFINTKSSSIEDVFEKAEIENADNDYLGKTITQTVNAAAEIHTDRISDMLFKMAVSIEKQSLLNAYPEDDEDYLEGIAIENVQKRYR